MAAGAINALEKDVAGYVLAGGASSRLGRDKALLELGGQPLLVRMCRLVECVTGQVAVIAAPERYAALGVRAVADRWPGAGPLGGIATALAQSASEEPRREWNLILGCDLPFVTREWLSWLADRAMRSSADVVLPQSATGLEPLCAAYRTRCAPTVAAALGRGVRKVTLGLEGLAVEIAGEERWKQFDPAGRLFKNINTPEDYAEAQAAWSETQR